MPLGGAWALPSSSSSGLSIGIWFSQVEGLRDSSLGWHPMMLFPTNLSLIQSEPVSHWASALSSGRGAHSLLPNSFQTSSVSSSHCELEPTPGSLSCVYVHMFVWVCGPCCWESLIMSLNSASHVKSQFCRGSYSKGMALWLFSPLLAHLMINVDPDGHRIVLGKMCWFKS